jgi:hypothetical protein
MTTDETIITTFTVDEKKEAEPEPIGHLPLAVHFRHCQWDDPHRDFNEQADELLYWLDVCGLKIVRKTITAASRHFGRELRSPGAGSLPLMHFGAQKIAADSESGG